MIIITTKFPFVAITIVHDVFENREQKVTIVVGVEKEKKKRTRKFTFLEFGELPVARVREKNFKFKTREFYYVPRRVVN